MITDYKRKQTSKKLVTPPWMIFAIGVAVGALIAVPLTVKYVSVPDHQPSMPTTGHGEASDKSSEDANRFTFYDILAGDEQLITLKSQDDGKSDFKPVVVQLGAFQDSNDADNLQAQLALLGFESEIETTDILGKGRWFRVRTGLINSVEELGSVTARLDENKVEYVIVRKSEDSKHE